ncbi:MAG: DUF4105 domain-containing protein [Candidatus Sumerlaeia bacterium]|nr:DUF4105 domain-containing protein [Candidatus Sumerlaeia bacterium]
MSAEQASLSAVHTPSRLSTAVAWMLVPFWLWSLAQIVAMEWVAPALRLLLAVWWTGATAGFLAVAPRRRRWAVVAGAVLVVQIGWMLRAPSIDRAWIAPQARMPVVRIDGDRMTVENVRHVQWRAVDDFEVRWEARTYDLSTLVDMEFLVVPFHPWRGVAHTFVSFGFDDGERLAISVEARRVRGSAYHPLKGLFRNYELIYVVGDERDLVGLRAFVEGDPVEIYPVRASRPAMRAMLEDMLARADALGRRPEFYNSLTSNCTSNVVRHYERLSGRSLGLDWRLVFPGFADELAFERGLLDVELPPEEARRRFRVSAQPPEAQTGAEWSRLLRERLGE